MKVKKLFSNPGYCPRKNTLRPRRRAFPLVYLVCGALLFALPLLAVSALAQEDDKTAPKAQSGGDMGEIGAKLSNPLGDVWALSTSFNMPQYYDGDVNINDPKRGATTLFQPILPIPIHGTGDGEWRVITRPIIPVIFSKPIPTGFNEFDHKSGIGDIQLPMTLNIPERYAGNFLLGGGPVGLFPSATDDDLSQDQWALGPAAVLGYKTKFLTTGVFPNYFWKVGSSGQGDDTPDINQGSMLYFLTLNLPNAWQAGFNPTITYNHQADSGEKWNVPVGLFVGRTTKIGKVPVNIKVGVEYSVVSPDTWGQRAQLRIQITPVMPSLISNPIFGK